MARPPKIYPRIKAPNEAECRLAAEFLYPDVTGIYTDDQRKEISKLSYELMYERLKKEEGVH